MNCNHLSLLQPSAFSLLLALAALPLFSQKTIFQQFTVEDGLSHGHITCIEQDKNGFIWIGTVDGLNRFDGYQFKQYRYQTTPQTGLSSNSIRHMETDAAGELWVATNKQLHHYDTQKDIFIPVQLFPDGRTITNDALFYLHQNQLLIFQQDTIFEWHQKKVKGQQVWELSNKTPCPLKTIGDGLCIFKAYQEVWIGGSNGLFQINQTTQVIRKDPTIAEAIYKIWMDELQNLIIAQSASQILLNKDKKWIFKWNQRNQIGQENLGRKWKDGYLITSDKAIFFWNGTDLTRLELPFHQTITASLVDRAGVRWLGLDTYGLVKLSEQRSIVERTLQPGKMAIYPPIIENNTTLGLFETDNLSGVPQPGVYCFFDPTTGKKLSSLPLCYYATRSTTGNYWAVDPNKQLIELNSKKIYPGIAGIDRLNASKGVSALRDGSLMLIAEDGNTLAFVQPQTGKIITLKNSMNLFHVSGAWDVSNIFTGPSASGWVWITLPGKLIGILPDWSKGTCYTRTMSLSDHPEALNENAGFVFAQGDTRDANTVWIGTWDGFFKWELSLNQVNRVPLNRHSHEVIFCMTQDEYETLWLGTKHGLLQYNQLAGSVQLYTTSNGLPANEFNRNTAILLPNGKIIMGTIGGWVVLAPQKERKDDQTGQMAVSAVSSGSQEYKLILDQKGYQLGKLASNTEHLFIYFSLLNTADPAPAQYRFRYITGKKNDWIYNGTNPSLVLSQLRSGNYTLEIQGSSDGSNWSSSTQLHFYIRPPWWSTSWFIFLSFLSIGGILFLFLRNRKMLLKEKHNREILEVKAQYQTELMVAQERLLTNIAHDLRSPLTLITGMAKKIKENQAEHVIKAAETIKYQALELLDLINQILQFSTLREFGSIPLNPQAINLSSELPSLLAGYSFQAEEKSISVRIQVPSDLPDVWMDKSGLKMILGNLLSNAIKFTPSKGSIFLEVQLEEDQLSFKVQDTGPGIPEEEAGQIFQRFYQGEHTGIGGFGIGLSFAAEMATQMGGKLFLEPLPPDKTGSCFTFQIHSGVFKEIQPKHPSIKLFPLDLIAGSNSERPIVVVVEDHSAMALYISSLLEPICEVVLAQDGEAGWDAILENIPDLVISDLVMHRLSGVALCERMRADIRTSHIPVIIISGNDRADSQQNSIHYGANLFLKKPFDTHLLQQYVANSLQISQKTKAYYQQQWEAQASKSTTNPTDPEENFITKLNGLIAQHYQQEDFTVERLASMLYISQSQLRRKVIALGGGSPGNMIRLYRLTKAKQLIEQSNTMSMSDIAYACGFADPNYFSTAFGKEFGITPKQYKQSFLMVNG